MQRDEFFRSAFYVHYPTVPLSSHLNSFRQEAFDSLFDSSIVSLVAFKIFFLSLVFRNLPRLFEKKFSMTLLKL